MLFLRILLFAGGVPLLLRLRLARLERLLEPGNVRAAPAPGTVQKIVDYMEGALRFGRPFVRRSCVTRGVTLYYFLRRAGVDLMLCFGVGKVGEDFAGHCWLVKDGAPFLETTDPRPLFAVVYRVAPTGPTLGRG